MTARRTKIVCTLGPATDSSERIRALIQAGMDVARLNFSHGDHGAHRQTIHAIREVSKDLGKEIGILQDLGGPKIRLGELPVKEREIKSGETVDGTTLFETGLVRKDKAVKILGAGDITYPLNIKVDRVSKAAREKIESAGGTVETG